jgi:thioredoxin 1
MTKKNILIAILIVSGAVITIVSSNAVAQKNAKPGTSLDCVPDTGKKCMGSTSDVVSAEHHTVITPAPASTAGTVPEKELLFFINPNGRPCQMQMSILDGMKGELSGLVKIKHLKTTDPADQNAFYQYGIRGLPSIIILDKNGKEFKRFSPGIQDEKTILAVLK